MNARMLVEGLKEGDVFHSRVSGERLVVLGHADRHIVISWPGLGSQALYPYAMMQRMLDAGRWVRERKERARGADASQDHGQV